MAAAIAVITEHFELNFGIIDRVQMQTAHYRYRAIRVVTDIHSALAHHTNAGTNHNASNLTAQRMAGQPAGCSCAWWPFTC